MDAKERAEVYAKFEQEMLKTATEAMTQFINQMVRSMREFQEEIIGDARKNFDKALNSGDDEENAIK